MRTNEPRKRVDYANIARQSVRRDFLPRPEREQKQETDEPPTEGATRRIALVSEKSEYFKFRHLLVGRLVRLIEKSDFGGGWLCEFVSESDRNALNKAAGWSSKTKYLFDNVKFK